MAPIENAWFYERLLLRLVMVIVIDKKMQRERCNANQNQFYALPEKDRAMLPVAFEEFEVVYMFKLLFSFRYNCQLVKGQIYPRPQPPGLQIHEFYYLQVVRFYQQEKKLLQLINMFLVAFAQQQEFISRLSKLTKEAFNHSPKLIMALFDKQKQMTFLVRQERK